MGLDELLHAGHDVAGIVEERLVGASAEVGQQHVAGLTGIVGEALGQGTGDGRDALARAAGDGDQPPAPSPRRRHVVGIGRERIVGDGCHGAGVLGEGVEEGGPVEVGPQTGDDAERVPVAGIARRLDDDGRDVELVEPRDEVAIDRREAAVEQGGGEHPTRSDPGPDLVDADALDELDGQQAGGGPADDVGGPRRSDVRESQHDEPVVSGHRSPASVVEVVVAGSRSRRRTTVTSADRIAATAAHVGGVVGRDGDHLLAGAAQAVVVGRADAEHVDGVEHQDRVAVDGCVHVDAVADREVAGHRPARVDGEATSSTAPAGAVPACTDPVWTRLARGGAGG